MSSSDEQDDKAFMKTFGGVMLLLTVGTIMLVGLALFAGSFDQSKDQARAEHERQRAEDRLRPVGAVRVDANGEPVVMDDGEAEEVAVEEDDDDDDDDVAMSGSEVNESVCMACHAAGTMDAPVTGDEDAWASLFEEKGLDELVNNAINGIGAMPARGGDSSLSDEEVREATIYMLEESGVEVDD